MSEINHLHEVMDIQMKMSSGYEPVSLLDAQNNIIKLNLDSAVDRSS